MDGNKWSEAQAGLLKNAYVKDGVAEGLSRKRERMTKTLKAKFDPGVDDLGRPKEEEKEDA